MGKLRTAMLLGIVLFRFTAGHSQLTSDEIDQLVVTTMTKFSVPGVAVGIVKDGEIIHSKGYGVKSVITNKKVNQHSQFALASVSKAFTTTALAILVDQGKIDWKDRVIDYIPEFTMYNSYVRDNFIIEDLLTHRSGLGLGAGDLMFIPDDNDFTIDDILSSFQYFEPKSAFRTQFDYDNLLYIVAGEVIKRVTTQSWEEFVQINILNPLGMDNSFTAFSSIKDKSNFALPHAEKDDTLMPITALTFQETGNGAAGGIFSNVDDFCQWMLVHLNHGKYGDNLEKELFSENRQREMWKMHISHVTYPSEPYLINFNGYGLGWMLSDINGYVVIYHSGGQPGIETQTILVPDLDLGIVVLVNRDIGVDPISLPIMDSYLGLPDNHWVDKIHEEFQEGDHEVDSITKQVWETVESVDDKHLNPQDFIGVYEDNWFGKIEVFNKEGKLWIRSIRSPKLNGQLQFYKANTFAVKWEYQDMNADAFALFYLDEEGKAESLKLKGISPNMDFSFDYQDLNLKKVE